jgi:hypothetical protein
VAAEIKKATGLHADLKVGGGGEFTVWLDDQLVAEKKLGVFPSPESIVAALTAALPPR